MVNIQSSKKSLIKSKFRQRLNSSNRSKLRTFIKKCNSAIESKNLKLAEKLYSVLQKTIDQQAVKGLIHKNRGARLKSKTFNKIKLYKQTSLK